MPRPKFKHDERRWEIVGELRDLDLQLRTGTHVVTDGGESTELTVPLNDDEAVLVSIADFILAKEDQRRA